MNRELPDVQAGFRKGTGTRDQIANIRKQQQQQKKQIANIRWIIEKAREFQKNIYFCFIDYTKAFDCVNHTNCGKFFKRGNTGPSYVSPEKSVCRLRSNSTGHGTTDWFQIGKGVRQVCILSSCLFNIYAEYIM